MYILVADTNRLQLSDESPLGGRNELIIMNSTIFWDITSCSLLKVNRRFGGTYRLHLHLVLATCFHAGFLLSLVFDPEDGGDIFLRNVG
jgi:hypothetical protein